MPGTNFDDSALVHSANLLLDYYDQLNAALPAIIGDPNPVRDNGRAFSPGFLLPDIDEDVREFFSAATVEWRQLCDYGGHRLHLMDLTGNPRTGTTKTFASLLMVARAIAYIRRYHESVTIFSPTSANKGTALRDAVLRAVEAGLVEPEQLRVVIVAPQACRPKLRASRLSDDPTLRALNPLLLYTGQKAEDVKTIGQEFVEQYATAVGKRLNTRFWYSLELRNYVAADIGRAFFEHNAAPDTSAKRVHTHAVSSAYGLLGYHQGRAALEQSGVTAPGSRPASLLVQHLGTPDMVLNLLHGDFSRDNIPAYELRDGLHYQFADARFPQMTADPDEVLDPTFYTHRPATSAAMNELIHRYGGDGVVVSLAECKARYPCLRTMLANTGCALPADSSDLREWSLVMAFTGTLNAIDRKLIDGTGKDVVVHGSGMYINSDYDALGEYTEVATPQDIAMSLSARG